MKTDSIRDSIFDINPEVIYDLESVNNVLRVNSSKVVPRFGVFGRNKLGKLCICELNEDINTLKSKYNSISNNIKVV